MNRAAVGCAGASTSTMLTLTLGPLVITGTQIAIGAALAVAALTGRKASRADGAGIGRVLVDMLIAGVIVARVAFVIAWFDLYRAAPWTMLDVRDGGFMPWAGWTAALLTAAWQARRHAALRVPLAVGLGAGGVAWAVVNAVLQLPVRPPLPEVTLTTLTGESVSLVQLAGGRPAVVNLWATWCPPCRREMPVLAAAQQREKDIAVIFVNQREDGATVHRYVSGLHPALENVVLDRAGEVGIATGTGALPTTLFYDAKGALRDTHVGEVSAASLADKLKRISGAR